MRRDALARAALGDAPATRNVLISGAVGTGKKLAARAIADLLRALGVSKGFVTTETTLDTLVLDVRRDVSTVRDSIFRDSIFRTLDLSLGHRYNGTTTTTGKPALPPLPTMFPRVYSH